MSNILLTCSCDSLAAKVIEKLGANNPVIIESSTNVSDISIAETICTYIFCVVLIGVLGFLIWKLLDHFAKGISEYYKRRCVVKDKELKLKADLLDKYLDFLKEKALKDDKWVKDYKKALAYLIEKSQNDKMNEITLNDLLLKEYTSSTQNPDK